MSALELRAEKKPGSLPESSMPGAKRITLHRRIKRALGYAAQDSDATVLKDWTKRTKRVCKPCWELRYCPYGPLVEQSPLLPEVRADAIDHNKYLRNCLKTGRLGDGRKITPDQRRMFKRETDAFRAGAFPIEIPRTIAESQCTVFGHICPVFFAAETFTETSKQRRTGRRYLPFQTKMRVVRRDNYTCQHCKVHLKDDEVEFDHIIPVARGGSSEEHNIRLTCHNCNREKSDHADI